MSKRRPFSAAYLILSLGLCSSWLQAASTETATTDFSWPRTIESSDGSKVQVHQPQIESWKDQQLITAWAAVEYLGLGQNKSALGTVQWEGQTSVALEERLVKFENIHIKQVNFPTLGPADTRAATAALGSVFEKDGLTLTLDRLLVAIKKSAISSEGISVNTNPPPIFYSKGKAVLVQFDGEPILSPIKDSPLKYVVNTNWDVILDPASSTFYLRRDKNWFSSLTVDKDWKVVKKLPKSFETFPKDPNWDDVRASIPAKNLSSGSAPLIYVCKQPGELIVTDGKPKTERVEKTNLLWVKNTEADVFRMKKGPYYVLVSGRWFRADKLEGPWTFASADLPPEFSKIPYNHPRARVRASIPGTEEATDAVLLAQIPQTLIVTREGAQGPTVKYDGEPAFTDIKGIKVSYATNCSNDVLKCGKLYYLCFSGVWFQSEKPEGPWELSTSIPPEIYKIPADCPMHHVTYVTVKSSDPTSVIYVQNAGYSGVTVSYGCVMWGTGWYYPPYYRYGGYYPVYYPYPHSYGSYAIYNSRTGAFGYGSSVSGPYGGISHAATYNPNTGTYARGTVAYGPGGARGEGHAYNPRTGTSLDTTQGRNRQGSWGSTKVQRGDSWAQSGHVKGDRGSVSGVRTSEGNGAIRASGENGSGFVGKNGDNVYAGKDGNVYRKTDSGWQQHGEGGWSDVNKPSAGTSDRGASGGSRSNTSVSTNDQLNRDAGNRGGSTSQRSNYGSGGAGSSNRGGGSYSGSRGGGSRGGGGGGRRR